MQILKNCLNKGGVYLLQNLHNNKRYVGSAVNIYHRIHTHVWHLKKGSHQNAHLQRAWNKYGERTFSITILASAPKEYLLKLEQWFINNLNPEYNILKVAGSQLGHKKSLESKLKQSRAIKGRKQSKEHVQKRTESRSKNWVVTSITREKIRLGNLGKKRTALSIEKQVQKIRKPVEQYDKDGNLLKIWDSIVEVRIALNLTSLSQILQGKKRSLKGGFTWKYHNKNKET